MNTDDTLTHYERLREFAATCPPDQRFHLLGMGPNSRLFEQAMDAILESCPEADVTCDAVRITALVGRTPLRPLTKAQDDYRATHPEAKGSEIKLHATRQVLGVESEALLRDNGWRDLELPPPVVRTPVPENMQTSA